MSYILEALKKLEEKKEREEAPRLTLSHSGERAPKKRTSWPYILTTVLLLNALAIMWWVSQRAMENGNRATEQAAGQVREAGRPVGGSGSTGNRSGSAPGAAGKHSGGSMLLSNRGAGLHSAQSIAPQTTEPGGKEVQTEGATPLEAPAAKEQPLETSSLSKPAVIEKEKPPARPEGGVRRNRKAPGRTLEISELPPTVREALPEFRISGHAYSPDPKTRVVRINETILQEGQELAPGLRVAEIVPDGVIFAFQGYMLRVRLNTGR
jgi:hypothetical protein